MLRWGHVVLLVVALLGHRAAPAVGVGGVDSIDDKRHASITIGSAASDLIARMGLTPIIPFCRRGHAQATAAYVDHLTGEMKRGVFVFAGYSGLNYESAEPGNSFLQDLWIIDVWTENSTGASSAPSAPSADVEFEFKHAFKRVTATNQPWPDRRWQAGSVATDDGWFLVYGGEDSYRGVYFEDAWAYVGSRWLQLPLFPEADCRHTPTAATAATAAGGAATSARRGDGASGGGRREEAVGAGTIGGGGSGGGGGGAGPSPSSSKAPGKRKGAALALLPRSGLVVLWGGLRPRTPPPRHTIYYAAAATASATPEPGLAAGVNGTAAVNAGGRKDRDVTSASALLCLSDVYVVNATSAIHRAAAARNISAVGSAGGGSAGASVPVGARGDVLSELQGGGWKRGRAFFLMVT